MTPTVAPHQLDLTLAVYAQLNLEFGPSADARWRLLGLRCEQIESLRQEAVIDL